MKSELPVCIFGGTAAYWLKLTEFGDVGDPVIVDTPYGPAAPITPLTTPTGPTVGFGSRHGEGTLQRSAAFVNHRANLWAAHVCGARVLFSWNGVGAIAPTLEVGDLIVPDDLIDFTRARVGSFGEAPFTENGFLTLPAGGYPFHQRARHAIIGALQDQTDGEEPRRFHTVGTYICSEGPRLETVAEIKMFSAVGADVVGMTLAPEVWLAAELGIAYASLSYVTNYATGRARGRPARRDFSPDVGKVCLAILLEAATRAPGREVPA